VKKWNRIIQRFAINVGVAALMASVHHRPFLFPLDT